MLRLLGMTIRGLLLLVLLLAVIVAVTLWAFRSQAGEREMRRAIYAAPEGGRFVRAGDVDLFVQEAGPADGQAVLFVHGTGAWSQCWRPTMDVLAQAGFHAFAIDLPPFGYSSRPSPPAYGKREQAQRIVAALDALQLPSAILVGHSFGGGPTVEAAMHVPGRVPALVLVDAALGVRSSHDAPNPPTPAWLREVLGFHPLRDGLVATFLTNPGFTRRLLQQFIADPDRATDEWVQTYQRPLNLVGTTEAVGAWLPSLIAATDRPPSEDPDAYSRLSMPVFILWGRDDTITPVAQGEHLKSLLPNATLAVLDHVGHIPQIEDPTRFHERLLQSLKSVAPAAAPGTITSASPPG